ncbi:MAG: AzlD domain-containing protein [Spirochaetales bacterium]|nr:AzlD domain-containing protein [Spirochaetales bacterium]
MTRVLSAVAAVAAVTFLTRATPFVLFARRRPPVLVSWLQARLPPLVMCVLVADALKGVRFGAPGDWVPTLAGAAAAAGLHLLRRNALLSIVGATALHMGLRALFGA